MWTAALLIAEGSAVQVRYGTVAEVAVWTAAKPRAASEVAVGVAGSGGDRWVCSGKGPLLK
jgi:hypothetical protein